MGNKNNMKNINTFLNKIGNNDKECINILEKVIMKILDNVLLAFEKDYYWIDIRITLPNNDFDIPRWHKDGRFFRDNKKSPKFGTILKGPGTLLIKSTKKTNEIYNDIKYHDKISIEEFRHRNNEFYISKFSISCPIEIKNLSDINIMLL